MHNICWIMIKNCPRSLRSIVTKQKARYLDFNQGVDARKINDETMEQLARLAIRPLRIAFDDIHLKDVYCQAVRTAHRYGIKEISNYILFNYKDKPEDLYERLRINIELNKELGIQIFSFPMKYSPISETDRTYIGINWCKKVSPCNFCYFAGNKGCCGSWI